MIIGDPSKFAVDIQWQSCESLADDGLSSTWCDLRLLCSDKILTRHVDEGATHDAISVPAASLAAWIGDSWAGLTSGERIWSAANYSNAHELLASLDEAAWDEHEGEISRWLDSHSLLCVRRGLVLPNVIFWRRGEFMDVSWRADPEARLYRGIQYLSAGSARLGASDVLIVFRELIKVVARQIASSRAGSAAKAEVVRANEYIHSPWTDLTETLAGRLGWPRDELESWIKKRKGRRSVEDVLATNFDFDPSAISVPEEVDSPVAMAARSASPNLSASDRQQLLKLAAELRELKPAERLVDLRGRVSNSAISPATGDDFERGYARANALRKALGNELEFLDVEQILMSLGCRVSDVELDDVWTDGIALWKPDGRALVAANISSARTKRAWGRRAMLAHEFFHLLFDASKKKLFGECTSTWTPATTEREANAFAAELLLPIGALPVSGETWTVDRWDSVVGNLCEKYNVGRELAIWQLRNRRRMPSEVVRVLRNNLVTMRDRIAH